MSDGSQDRQLWVSLSSFFKLDVDSVDTEAFNLWNDLSYNKTGWYGWSSFLDGWDMDSMKELCELYLNAHAAIKVHGESVYTQLPIRHFFYGIQQKEYLYVRGALWSNGALWEEMHWEEGRSIVLMVDKTTVDAFKYPKPGLTPEFNAIHAKVQWQKAKSESDNKDKNVKDS